MARRKGRNKARRERRKARREAADKVIRGIMSTCRRLGLETETCLIIKALNKAVTEMTI